MMKVDRYNKQAKKVKYTIINPTSMPRSETKNIEFQDNKLDCIIVIVCRKRCFQKSISDKYVFRKEKINSSK